jgi:hypothetical protein
MSRIRQHQGMPEACASRAGCREAWSTIGGLACLSKAPFYAKRKSDIPGQIIQPGLRLIDHMSVERLVMSAATLTMAALSRVIIELSFEVRLDIT